MFQPTSEYNYHLKFYIVGSKGSGKSSLILRYSDDIYTDSFISNLGIDFKSKYINVAGKDVRLQIWDSQESYIENSFKTFPKSDVIMQLVDLSQSDEQMIKDITRWKRPIDLHASNKTVIVVGTKSDLYSGNITELRERFQDVLKKSGCSHVKHEIVSAKNALNIDAVFTRAAQDCLRAKFGIVSSKDGKVQENASKEVKSMSREELEAEVERLRSLPQKNSCPML